MGLVVASGMSIGTLFTLFVLPTMYMLLAKDHHPSGTGEVEAAQRATT